MAEAPEAPVIRTAVGVAPEHAQETRLALSAGGLLDKDAQPERAEGRVWFALVPSATEGEARRVLLQASDLRVMSRPVQLRTRRPIHYKELLTDLPQELQAILPTGYDVIGDVLIIKLPEPLLAHKTRIAAALLVVHANIKTITLDRGVTGDLRIRDLEVIGGAPTLTTIHRENGLDIEIALDKAYFSPRLATERQRLVARIRPGQRVLDLFAGVGAFVCLAARDQSPSALCAIDLNPDAVALLRNNLHRNKITAPVDIREGDARAVAPRTSDWDHVVMNLPHGATEFLDVAAACVAPHGEVHLYAMVERTDHDRFIATLEEHLSVLAGTRWRVVDERHVRNYAPTMDGLGFTLRAG